MSEEAVKEAPAKVEAPAVKPSGGLMGPLLAVIVLLGAGSGGTYFVMKLLTPKPSVGAEAEGKGEHHHEEEGGEKGNALAGLAEVQLQDLVSNVKNQSGKRYVKISCSLWLAHDDVEKIVPAAEEGGHEGTPKENETVKRILRMRLEEHLRSYEIEDLTSPNVYTLLQNGFREQIERELHSLYRDVGPDYRFIKRVVLNNLLVQ